MQLLRFIYPQTSCHWFPSTLLQKQGLVLSKEWKKQKRYLAILCKVFFWDGENVTFFQRLFFRDYSKSSGTKTVTTWITWNFSPKRGCFWWVFKGLNFTHQPRGFRFLQNFFSNPGRSMYGIFTYMWVLFMVNVGKLYHTLSVWEWKKKQLFVEAIFWKLDASIYQWINIPTGDTSRKHGLNERPGIQVPWLMTS